MLAHISNLQIMVKRDFSVPPFPVLTISYILKGVLFLIFTSPNILPLLIPHNTQSFIRLLFIYSINYIIYLAYF